jgi:hypothetical protein
MYTGLSIQMSAAYRQNPTFPQKFWRNLEILIDRSHPSLHGEWMTPLQIAQIHFMPQKGTESTEHGAFSGVFVNF